MVRGDGPWPTESAEQAVAWEDGVITYVGPADGLSDVEPEWFEGCTIAPGFVDCHTHLPFAGWRADEFEARLAGVSYRELHGEGGIYRSARMLAEASDDEVLAFSRSLVQEMADARHDGPRAQDRLRPLRRGRAPAGSPRPPARAGGAADLFGHAARVPRGARRDGARRLGPNGVRRADPGRRERGPRRRGRRLRRGHRVHGRRPRRGREVAPRRPGWRSAATPTSSGPRAPPRPRSRSGRGARTT